MRKRPSYLILGVTTTVMAVLAIVLLTQPSASQQETVAPHFWTDPSIRTIVVAAPNQQLPRKDDILLTELVAGSLPANVRTARVLTDSNCAPDAQGVSHCLNQLQIGSATVTVQHHHDMRNVPCLSPGETVNVLTDELFQQLPRS
jgi:outer membrane usher protein FimD/PapC